VDDQMALKPLSIDLSLSKTVINYNTYQ